MAPAFEALVARACHDAGLTLRVKYEVEHPQTILAIVEAGLGISLVPASLQVAGGLGSPIGDCRPPVRRWKPSSPGDEIPNCPWSRHSSRWRPEVARSRRSRSSPVIQPLSVTSNSWLSGPRNLIS